MKKAISILVALVIVTSVLAGCSWASQERPQIYIFVKNRGDLSMWDSIAAGGDKAAIDFKDRADVYVTETTADIQACLTAMYEAADAGANLMYAGNDYTDNILEVGAAFPEIAMVSAGNRDNMTDQLERMYAFQVKNDATFLAGIIAADIASRGSGVIGFVGAMDESVNIQNRFLGYMQGAKHYNDGVKIMYNYVGSYNDPDVARTQALAQYNDAKAEIIYFSSGASGNGVYTAAGEVEKCVIGDDVNQAEHYTERPEIASRFVTSHVVNYNVIVYNVIEKFLNEGKLNYGHFEFLGLAEGAVSCVEDDNFEKYVSAEGKAAYMQAKEGLISGKIQPVGALDKDQTEIKALFAKFLGN